MPLSKIQERFKADMLSSEEYTLDDIFESGRIPLNQRLDVYRNNILGSLGGVIADNFPTVQNLVGVEFMTMMAKAYILEHPPEGGCLDQYGSNFPSFIASYELTKALPYLPDVAAFDLAYHEAYYARDDQALKPEGLANIAPEDLGSLNLRLRDNVKLIASNYPLRAIRDFCQRENRGDDETLDLNQGGVKLMVTRPHLKIEVIELDDPAYEMLMSLKQGHALGEAVENTLNTHESFDFQGFLQNQLRHETFLTLHTNS